MMESSLHRARKVVCKFSTLSAFLCFAALCSSAFHVKAEWKPSDDTLRLPQIGDSIGRQGRWIRSHPVISSQFAPQYPNDESLEVNLRLASWYETVPWYLRSHARAYGRVMWVNRVREGGIWDYKTRAPKWEYVGNWNYAVTGLELGYTQDELLLAAGVVQISTNFLKGRSLCGTGAYCDYANDTRTINHAFIWTEEIQMRRFLSPLSLEPPSFLEPPYSLLPEAHDWFRERKATGQPLDDMPPQLILNIEKTLQEESVRPLRISDGFNKQDAREQEHEGCQGDEVECN